MTILNSTAFDTKSYKVEAFLSNGTITDSAIIEAKCKLSALLYAKQHWFIDGRRKLTWKVSRV